MFYFCYVNLDKNNLTMDLNFVHLYSTTSLNVLLKEAK